VFFTRLCFEAPCLLTPLPNFRAVMFGLWLAAFYYPNLFLIGISFSIYAHFRGTQLERKTRQDRSRGSRKLRLPGFSENRQWQGCQPYAPAAFTPREDPWYSFLSEAET
jgi:hypothetical protein